MNTRKLALSALLGLALLGGSAANADMGMSHAMKGPMHTMAGIIMHLNHYPSTEEKESLRAIIDDKAVSEYERVLAQALLNMKHKASAADKEKLQAIMNDASTPQQLRDMAAIVHGLNHMPSAADKKKLGMMMN